MTKKYRCLCAIVIFGLLCHGCAKKDEPNDSEEAETTLEAVDSDNQETVVASIQPGIGVGKVRFGMSFTELKDILGKPDFDVKGLGHVYADLGIQVIIRDDKVIAVNCFQHFPNAPEVKSCEYQTAEGIGIGSSESDILAAYNEPSRRRNGALSYRELGLLFELANDRVQSISVAKP